MSDCQKKTVSARRRAGKLNLYIEQGATFQIPIVYKEDDAPVNLTGAIVKSQFREKVSHNTPLISLGSDSGGIVLDGPNGKITMTITAAQTGALKVYAGVWDMIVTFTNGEVIRILNGSFEVSRGVTR